MLAAENFSPPEDGDTDAAHIALYFPAPPWGIGMPLLRHCAYQKTFLGLSQRRGTVPVQEPDATETS